MLRAIVVCLLLAAPLRASQSPAARPPNPFGEPARNTTPHLTVESTISATSAAPGSRLTVTVDVTPRRAMHVYAPGKHDYQVVGLTLTSQSWAKVDPTKYPPSEKYFFEPLNETVEVYSKPFRLTRDVTLLETPEARKALAGQSTVVISGQLEYQACDDKICYQPGKVPIRLEVTLK